MTPVISPPPIEAAKLSWEKQTPVMPGDLAFFSVGHMSEADGDLVTFSESSLNMARTLRGNEFYQMGELAEKPSKIESKATRLATRNSLVSGMRSSSVEIVLNGISNAQKDYYENAFANQLVTIVLAKNEIMPPDTTDEEAWNFDTEAMVYSGLYWKTNWKSTSDELNSLTITAELRGDTDANIYPLAVPAHTRRLPPSLAKDNHQ